MGLDFTNFGDARGRPPKYVWPGRRFLGPASGGDAPRRRAISSRGRSRASSSTAANGLTWVHVDEPTRRGGGDPRRALRLPRARRRGRPLEAPAAEDRRVRRLPLRRPPLPVLRQGDPAAERGRAGRLHRQGLPDHAPERGAPPGHVPLPPLRRGPGPAGGALRQGVRVPALPRPRRPLRLLLPDPRQDRAQARPDRGRDVRGPLRGGRARPLEREAGDHRVPEDHQARALHTARARALHAALPARGTRALLRRHRRRGRADLGPPGQLQGGGRGARADERVGHLPQARARAVRADRDRDDRAARSH